MAETLQDPSRLLAVLLQDQRRPAEDGSRRQARSAEQVPAACPCRGGPGGNSRTGRIGYPPARAGRNRARDRGLAGGPATCRLAADWLRGRRDPLSRPRRFAARLARIDVRAAMALAEDFQRSLQHPVQGRRRPGPGRPRSGGLGANLREADEQEVARREAHPSRSAAWPCSTGRGRGGSSSRWISRGTRPSRWGAMAESLADADRKAAAAMLDEALRRLEQIARRRSLSGTMACVAAGHLLPTAEQSIPNCCGAASGRPSPCGRPGRPAATRPARTKRESRTWPSPWPLRPRRGPPGARAGRLAARSLVERCRSSGPRPVRRRRGDRPGLGRRPGRRLAR